MRSAKVFSLVLLTSCVALCGCAADADPASGETQPNIALTEPTGNVQHDKTQDVGQTGKVSDLYANPADDQRARIIEHYVGGQLDPRIETTVSGFDAIPPQLATKLGNQLPVFHAVSPLVIGMTEDPGYTPYSHPKP